jgi:hypothetical protein
LMSEPTNGEITRVTVDPVVGELEWRRTTWHDSKRIIRPSR